MNFTRKKCSIVVLCLFAFVNESFAQINSFKDSLLGQVNTITTAVPFLLISPDARAGGMGDNGVATSPDANSIHWNPAKLAFIEKNIGFSVSYTPWLRELVNDINLAYLSGYKKLKGDQTIAMSLLYFSLGNIDFTNETGDKTGQFNPNEFAIDAAYARKLGEGFSGGLALRYIYSNLTGGVPLAGNNAATHAGTSIAADLSAYYHTDIEVGKKKSVLAIGLDISNIGTKISYTESGTKDFIPTNFRLGSSLKMDLDQYNSLAFAFDINKLLVPTPPVYWKNVNGGDSIYDNQRVVRAGEDPTNVSVAQALFSSWSDAPAGFSEEVKEFVYTFGLEYWYDKQFALRGGYFHEAETKGNRQFFTIGAGLRYNVFGLDFAYLIPTVQRNPLANTLRFTLTFDFDGLKNENKSDDQLE